MPVPYESTGRARQKLRTREALLLAARELLRGGGPEPTVEEVAQAAGISRTTAYRYFPNQRSLVLAAHPETRQRSLLPAGAPADPFARLDLTMAEFARIILEWEPQLRAALRLSLTPGPDSDGPALRQGRAIGWIEDALDPLRATHPGLDVPRLAGTIRAATGIEALVWLTDVAGVPRSEIPERMRWTARALLAAALADAAGSATPGGQAERPAEAGRS
ncbi:TetR/AcrR family transcriptional regulator [Amorphoplanes nipponensis]|uniref:TetR family transcriptional regulator n=1 Tax=Actinoplanes nipponensis TaxID=135950 RepID=A0A919JIR3_9ACTN|nr:TetR/AcrR family transcriptional regulator [Actinoplanes nipponensis]GIE50025.1 TetR family transcriptional regulator [Actinoplanes nipponensis]